MRKVLRNAVLAAVGIAATGAAVPRDFVDQSYYDDDRYVVLVRHAEKEDGDDPDLTSQGRARAETLAHVLGEWPVEAIFVTQFLRTQATAVPLAERFGLEAEIVDAGDVAGTAERLKMEGHEAAVVVGHSNSTPDMARALGVQTVPEIPEYQYDDLFVVRLTSDGEAHLLHMKYGAPTPEADQNERD